MSRVYNSLSRNGAWKLKELPEGRVAFGSKRRCLNLSSIIQMATLTREMYCNICSKFRPKNAVGVDIQTIRNEYWLGYDVMK